MSLHREEEWVFPIKSGNLNPEKKKKVMACLLVLKEAGKPLVMTEISRQMKDWGFKNFERGKGFYDLNNSLADLGLVKKTKIEGEIETFEITKEGIKYLGA